MSFRTSTFLHFPSFFHKKILTSCQLPAFWALPHRILGVFSQFSGILALSEQLFPTPVSPREIPSTFYPKRGFGDGIKFLFPREWPEGGAASKISVPPIPPLLTHSSLFLVPDLNPASGFAPGKEICPGIVPRDGFSRKRMEMPHFPAVPELRERQRGRGALGDEGRGVF